MRASDRMGIGRACACSYHCEQRRRAERDAQRSVSKVDSNQIRRPADRRSEPGCPGEAAELMAVARPRRRAGRTSSRCWIRWTSTLPSAAKPLTAIVAVSVLERVRA
jgi:hypothetical protein